MSSLQLRIFLRAPSGATLCRDRSRDAGGDCKNANESRNSVVLITLGTMVLHAILQLAGVPKPTEVTPIFIYPAMIAYMVALYRADELL